MTLTQSQVRELFDYDPASGIVTRSTRVKHDCKAKNPVGSKNSDGYLSVWINPKRYQLHRVIWLWLYGSWPSQNIDHRNRNRADNRKLNLRDASCQENNQNHSKSIRNWSGYTGVHWYARRYCWQAQIMAARKKHHLGYFDTPELASAAYQAAKLIYHPTAPK